MKNIVAALIIVCALAAPGCCTPGCKAEPAAPTTAGSIGGAIANIVAPGSGPWVGTAINWGMAALGLGGTAVAAHEVGHRRGRHAAKLEAVKPLPGTPVGVSNAKP